MNVLDLFSGIGGFSLGLERAGFNTVAFCECDKHCQYVLKKYWPHVPIFDDVQTLTKEKLLENGIEGVDVICGGFPCQDASVAQTIEGRRVGIEGKRTGLWCHIKRIAPCFPEAILLLENVPGLLSAGFGTVLGDLAEIGYDAEWGCVRASEFGLPHRRERLIIVAYARGSRWQRPIEDKSIFERAQEAFPLVGDEAPRAWCALDGNLESIRGCDGIPVGVERRRLHQCGNAVLPQKAECFGRAIKESLMM